MILGLLGCGCPLNDLALFQLNIIDLLCKDFCTVAEKNVLYESQQTEPCTCNCFILKIYTIVYYMKTQWLLQIRENIESIQICMYSGLNDLIKAHTQFSKEPFETHI